MKQRKKTTSSLSLPLTFQLSLTLTFFTLNAIGQTQATQDNCIVNEIMVANVDQWLSPSCNYDAWIELYNPTEKAVSLNQIYLSNRPDTPLLWHTPVNFGVIPPHGYKLIWFDDALLTPHIAIFKLDQDGGRLIISNQGGATIADITYPKAIERCSWARTTDAGQQWAYTGKPTPQGDNANTTYAQQQLPDPQPTANDQLFSTTFSFSVPIPEGATLRYTINGSLPTTTNGITSTTGVFPVSQTTTYRFRFFSNEQLPSRAVTRSFIKRDRNYAGPIISVVGDQRFFYNDSIGVLTKGTNGKPGRGQDTNCNWNMDWDRPVNFAYIPDNGQQPFNQDVNLAVCGGWSRAWNPHSFKLKGNKELGGNKNLNYTFFKEKPYIRNRTLQMRNGGNDNWCRIKDPALEAIMLTSNIDIDLQAYQPCHVLINGQYYGVLNMREPNNKHYVYANYGWDDDQIDQWEIDSDSGYVQKCGTPDSFDQLCEVAKQAALETNYKEVLRQLDIDEYLNYMAAQLYLGGTDWPHNNNKAFVLRDGGRWRFVSFDLDFAFYTNNSFNDFANKATYTFAWLYNKRTQRTQQIKMVSLFTNLLNNPGFRRKFTDTYCLMAGSVFDPTRANHIVDSLSARANPMLWLEWASTDPTAADIKQNLSNRQATMIKAMRNYTPMQLKNIAPQKARLGTNVEGAALFINQTQVPMARFNGQLFAPVTLRAVAPAGHRFVGWRDANGTFYSNAEKTDMPKGDFQLTAIFEPTGEASPAVTVNEVSAANDAYVNDYFKKNDWVELYNTTDRAIDVEGMYLSDNPDKPKKFRISRNNGTAQTVVPAHGHLIIWCDKLQTQSQLHAGFKLGAEGGTVMLTAADESFSDALSYPAMTANETAGRFPDGAPQTYLFNQPTIARPNRMTSYAMAYENLSDGLAITSPRTTDASLSLRYAADCLIAQSQQSAPAHLRIFTLAGQQVLSQNLQLAEPQSIISIATLHSGSYVAILSTANGQQTTCKFLK